MESIVLLIHILVCILLVVVVLLQSGKSADLAGAFGGAGSQSTFGPRGTATFLSKLTTTLAILFMVTSLMLWIIGAYKSSGESVITSDDKAQEQPAEGAAPKTEEKKDVSTPVPASTGEVKTEQPAEQPVATPPADTAKPEEKKEEQKPGTDAPPQEGANQG